MVYPAVMVSTSQRKEVRSCVADLYLSPDRVNACLCRYLLLLVLTGCETGRLPLQTRRSSFADGRGHKNVFRWGSSRSRLSSGC